MMLKETKQGDAIDQRSCTVSRANANKNAFFFPKMKNPWLLGREQSSSHCCLN